jgi:hypothetical protein
LEAGRGLLEVASGFEAVTRNGPHECCEGVEVLLRRRRPGKQDVGCELEQRVVPVDSRFFTRGDASDRETFLAAVTNRGSV